MINMLFLKIVEMSLTAGIVILVVMLVRLLIRRLPKSFSYALWIVVAFRLAVPVAADSDISIFHMFTAGRISSEMSGSTKDKAAGVERADIADGNASYNNNIEGQIMQWNAQNDTMLLEDKTGNFQNVVREDSNTVAVQAFNFIEKLALVWAAGILTLVSYTVIAHIRIRRTIRYGVRLYDNVYECDNIRSPFVTGMFSPKIYLPFRLNEVEQQCILSHERYHIRRKDYLIKSFAYLLMIVYWFHPLVWAAYRLMCIDMEMSCDEKVVAEFTVDLRKEYSRLLLAFASNKRQLSASPLAFGEENTMKRIRNILNYKKTAQWKRIGGVAVLVLTMTACATDAGADDTSFVMRNDAENMTGVSEKDNNDNNDNNANSTVYYSEEHDIDSYHQEEQSYHFIEHQQAQWAENSMFDLEFYSLDYADNDRIVFHISSGLFEYDLKSRMLTNSIDLKSLNCQAVQTGGECEVAVYQDGSHQLRAVIKPYPYSDADSYVYDIESDALFAYDASLLDGYVLFDGFASKYDSTVSEAMRTWRAAENVLPLGENSYGALYWGPGPDLVNLSYEAGEQKWEIFRKEQATLPKLQRQDDSFYQSFSLYSGRNLQQCILDYTTFYNNHDYDGVCALSTGLNDSDELRRAFGERTDSLSGGMEVSHSEDEKEYLYWFTCVDDSGKKEQKVYLNFKYLDGEGWRAEGLPTVQSGD